MVYGAGGEGLSGNAGCRFMIAVTFVAEIATYGASKIPPTDGLPRPCSFRELDG